MSDLKRYESIFLPYYTYDLRNWERVNHCPGKWYPDPRKGLTSYIRQYLDKFGEPNL